MNLGEQTFFFSSDDLSSWTGLRSKKPSCPPYGSEGDNNLIAASPGAHAGACGIRQLLKTTLFLCRKLFSTPEAQSQAEGSLSAQLI